MGSAVIDVDCSTDVAFRYIPSEREKILRRETRSLVISVSFPPAASTRSISPIHPFPCRFRSPLPPESVSLREDVRSTWRTHVHCIISRDRGGRITLYRCDNVQCGCVAYECSIKLRRYMKL